MGREARRVPANWQHPKDNLHGHFIGLHGGSYAERAKEWDEENAKWERGEFPDDADEGHRSRPYDQWDGPRPLSSDYMPDWPEAERTHIMMYETTSEGTPISPAFATPEELARWLTDTEAGYFADWPAPYHRWLEIAQAAT